MQDGFDLDTFGIGRVCGGGQPGQGAQGQQGEGSSSVHGRWGLTVVVLANLAGVWVMLTGLMNALSAPAHTDAARHPCAPANLRRLI
jgi:hypothetical protein